MIDKPKEMRQSEYDAFDTIDAMFHTGDITDDKEKYEFTVAMIQRWTDRLLEIEMLGDKTFEKEDDDEDEEDEDA